MSSDSAKKRAGIGLQCLPTAPKLLIDTAAISVHRRFRAASSHANLSMLHHFGANARVRVRGHSLQVRPRPLVHKCPLCINTDRKFWALGFVAMCQLRTSAALHSIISSAMLSSCPAR